MSSYQQDRSETGLDRIRLRNRYVDLCILPEVGGKIVELIELPGNMPLRVDDYTTRHRCQPEDEQRWPVLQMELHQ